MDNKAYVYSVMQEWSKDLRRRKNVVGVTIGKKIVNGVQTDEDAIIVLVREKVPASQLAPADLIPLTLTGVPTDVYLSHDINAFQDPRQRWRPAPGGVSLGHYRVTAGTLGVTVEDAETRERLILSNNHVIALSNEAWIGDPILQPGPADGGSDADEVGQLARFIPIRMDSTFVCFLAEKLVNMVNRILTLLARNTRLAVVGCQQSANIVDCAVAKPNNVDDLDLDILVIGRPKAEPVAASIGMEVQKFGRTTGYTKDKVIGLEATINVSYGPGRVATFEHQIIAGPMSAGGDSGSLILDMENRPVGLLFAGSETVTAMNEIDRVLGALKVRFPSPESA